MQMVIFSVFVVAVLSSPFWHAQKQYPMATIRLACQNCMLIRLYFHYYYYYYILFVPAILKRWAQLLWTSDATPFGAYLCAPNGPCTSLRKISNNYNISTWTFFCWAQVKCANLKFGFFFGMKNKRKKRKNESQQKYNAQIYCIVSELRIFWWPLVQLVQVMERRLLKSY